jgi:hypothetical protein
MENTNNPTQLEIKIWMKIYREDYPKLHLDTNYNKEQLVIGKEMDVNEHERLSNITLGHKL